MFAEPLNPVNTVSEEFAGVVLGRNRGALLGESVEGYAQQARESLYLNRMRVSVDAGGTVQRWLSREGPRNG